MNTQSVTGQQHMNSKRPVVHVERRKGQRRKLRGLQIYASALEPNRFSRRAGFDRRQPTD